MGDSTEVGHAPAKTAEKIALGQLRQSPALHPSERSSHGKLTIEGGYLRYQTQFTASKLDWQMLRGTPPKSGTPLPKLLKKSPSADFNGVLLCIRVSDPLAVNSLSKGDLPYQTQFTASKSDWQMLQGTPLKSGTPCQNCTTRFQAQPGACNATVKTSNNEKCA